MNLLNEAVRLASDAQEHGEGLRQDALDTIEFIESQQLASRSKGTLGKLGHVLTANLELSMSIQRILEATNGIRDQCDPNYYAKGVGDLQAFRTVDLARIADEELLRELVVRRDRVLGAHTVMGICIASAEIPAYSLLFGHHDVLRAYVGRPSRSRRGLDAVRPILEAAVVDAVGTAVPFLGTAIAAVRGLEPWVEREGRRMATAVSVVDRLFDLDEGLSGLVEFAALVEPLMPRVSQFLDAYRESFNNDVEFLLTIAAAASEVD